MKISKLKALTIATTVIGSASLASVAGVTTVAVLDNQTSDNQSYSQTANGDGNGDNGQPNVDNGGNSTGDNSSNTNPNPGNQPNNGVVTENIIKQELTTKKTTDPTEKVFDALNQIKTIDDVWNFYPMPNNIPSNFSIALNNVKTTSQTPDLNLGLQVTVTINGNTPAAFVIYGFSPYTDQEYKQIFEAANPSGKFTKNGRYFPYVDYNDLSKDPNSPNYLGNYFKPVIPVELSANNIVATPDSFNLLPNNVVNYNYVLHSQDNKVSVNASVPVSAYYEYQYPNKTDAYKPVKKTWEPINSNFIKANLPVNFTRTEFDNFIWRHWNGSTLADAINAYRYWYLFDESNMTSKLKSYVLSTGDTSSKSGKYPIGLIIRGGTKVNDITSYNPRRSAFAPTYDASMSLDGSNSVLRLNWHLPYLINDFLRIIAPVAFGKHVEPPYNIDAGLNINFNSSKPAALVNGLVQIPVTVTTDINLDNYLVKEFVYKYSHVVKQANWNVLDALYYYFKMDSYSRSSSPSSYYQTPFFDQFSETLKKAV